MTIGIELHFKLHYKLQHLKDAVASYPMGRFDNEEVFAAAKGDLKALSALLGTQKYFFGKDPSLVCSLVSEYFKNIDTNSFFTD